MSNNNYRIFVGLKLSGYLVSTIPMIKSTIEDKKQLINWVSGKNLHLTLSFIGEINPSKIEELKIKLDAILDFNSFDLNINGTGCFPSSERPRIFWLDINEGQEQLSNIQSNIEEIVSPFKENMKNENFIPHITIGRVKNVNKNINLDLTTFSNAVYSDIKVPVKTIYLFKSQLLETGVDYSVLSEYSLK